MHNQVKATVITPFPRATRVAKTFGVPHARAAKIVSLMDRIAVNAVAYQFTTSATRKRKAIVAKKKKK
jgi:hypothetical protein